VTVIPNNRVVSEVTAAWGRFSYDVITRGRKESTWKASHDDIIVFSRLIQQAATKQPDEFSGCYFGQISSHRLF
jgi:hypothetical protein